MCCFRSYFTDMVHISSLSQCKKAARDLLLGPYTHLQGGWKLDQESSISVSFAQETVHQRSALCTHVDWSSYIPRKRRVQRGIKAAPALQEVKISLMKSPNQQPPQRECCGFTESRGHLWQLCVRERQSRGLQEEASLAGTSDGCILVGGDEP